MRIKTFTSCNAEQLEEMVNDFLDTGIEIRFVSQSESYGDGQTQVTISIFYKK